MTVISFEQLLKGAKHLFLSQASTTETSNNNMVLVEKSSSSMVIDTSSIANLNNGNNVSNIGNNTTEKYELRWKGFEGNLIRYKSYFQ